MGRAGVRAVWVLLGHAGECTGHRVVIQRGWWRWQGDGDGGGMEWAAVAARRGWQWRHREGGDGGPGAHGRGRRRGEGWAWVVGGTWVGIVRGGGDGPRHV